MNHNQGLPCSDHYFAQSKVCQKTPLNYTRWLGFERAGYQFVKCLLTASFKQIPSSILAARTVPSPLGMKLENSSCLKKMARICTAYCQGSSELLSQLPGGQR